MCVIIAKNKKSRIPSKNELKNCFYANSDGAGFMYTDNKQLIIDKGYMSYKDFIKRYEELCKKYNNFENKSLVIHCRITTDGSTSVKNCHPFPVCDSIKKMQQKTNCIDLGVAHNGIIVDYRPDKNDKQDISDTINFIKKYLAPIKKHFKDFYKNQAFLDGVEIITGSKFAFLDNEDILTTCGNFIEQDGLLFSNNSFIDYIPYKYSECYNNYYDDFYYDDSEIELDNIRDKDFLIEIYNDYFAEIPIEDDVDDYSYNILTIGELKIDDNSKMYYNPFTYSIIEINAEGIQLQKISYINVYDSNYTLVM